MDTKLLFQKAKEAGILEIEVYRVKKSETSITIFNHEVDKLESNSTDVCHIRGAYNNHLGSIYVENNNVSIDEIVETIKSNASLININEPYFIYPGDEKYPTLKPYEGDFDSYTLADKTKLCLDLADLIEAEHEYVDSCPDVTYSEEYFEYSIVNSNGLNVSKKGGYAYLIGEVVVKRGEEIKTGFDVKLAKKYADFNIKEMASKMVKDTVSQLGAAPIDSGEYKVVVKNNVMRSLLGVFTSVFSAETLIQKMSFLEGKEDSKVFGDNITIVDDPLCELAPSQDSFDDEGVSAKVTPVVENGVFKTFLHNLKTATMLGKETTGNGYKAGVSGGVTVRPSNFYIKPGEYTEEQLFKMCGDGFYLTSVAGLHAGVNIINGDFSLQASGYTIKDGKVKDPVNLIIASGNITKLLNEVIALGSNLDFATGSIGAPALLVKGLSISGK